MIVNLTLHAGLALTAGAAALALYRGKHHDLTVCYIVNALLYGLLCVPLLV